MHDQHLSVINTIKAEKPRERKMVSVYLKEVKTLIRVDNREGALRTLDEALTEHPFNALLLSYYGYLDAIVNKNYERGKNLCKTAIEIFEEESREEGSLRHKGFQAVLYLHLGRTYLAGGTKKSAVKAFKRGLKADPKDTDLLSEVRRIGIRRKPIFPFLKRSNPINKYIGMLIHNK
jgi:tetratricopeptide (TPR) repeat protein